MGLRIWLNLLVISIQILVAAAVTDSQEYGVLQSLKSSWENTPPNWVRPDPCGDDWVGIQCNNSHVISITLGSIGLKGQLSGDIQFFPELQILDLSFNKELTGSIPPSIGNLKKLINLALIGCGFTGPIPDTIGSLQQLVRLSLNSNGLIGQIPPSIGNLRNLSWLDLSDNSLTGSLPVSDVATQGLDMLVNAKHFHFENNRLSGDIPSRLFSRNMTLLHVFFDGNQLTGNIPSSLGDVQTLEVVRLDRNQLNGPIPSNLCNLIHLSELNIANNQLNGLLPNLTGLNSLLYMDVSNNTLNIPNIPPSISTLQSLTTLMMENTGLRGEIPKNLFSLPQLDTVLLKNNRLNGTLDIGSSYSHQPQLIDLRNNSIDSFTQRREYTMELILVDNPYCNGREATSEYCVLPPSNSSYSTEPNNCMPTPCSQSQVSSPNCRCAYPYMGTLYFRAFSFSHSGNSTAYVLLQRSLVSAFDLIQLPVDSVSLSNPTKNLHDYLVINLAVFPSGEDRFNRTAISGIVLVFSSLTLRPPPELFGPYFFIGDRYEHFAADAGSRKSSSSGVVIGAAIGGSVLGLLVLVAGVYAFRQKQNAERSAKQNNPFASWDANKGSGDVPQFKGARCFSFEVLKKCTNNFSEANAIGTGGYGKVYRGILPKGQLVAIKRPQHRSMQGGYEFKTEIELLSRVHHKNVVGLVGFCFEQGEQMLVYEYIPNGTLKDNLSGRSGIWLDWMRRLRIAIGVARGLQYLHDLADPPIIHRDVKSNNILLDEHLNAKVADFGLSKSLSDAEQGHVTTQVKGTMGYLDPEYYMTQQLTEKSDVYSFGVLLLELVTRRNPIEKGKYIVSEVKQAMDMTKDLYSLQSILDPALGSSMAPKSVKKFVDLVLRCAEEAVVNRPLMSEVVKEIEIIMELVGLNPNVKSTSTTYEGTSTDSNTP